jgi:hypothetical protein
MQETMKKRSAGASLDTPRSRFEEHARGCAQCGATAFAYARELCCPRALPEGLLARIRARMCREGAQALDALVAP